MLMGKAEGVFGPRREVSVRLCDEKLICTPPEEDGEAAAGEGAQLMPCPSTIVDRNPNYGLGGRDNLLWAPVRAVLGSCRPSVQGLTRLKTDQHRSTFWTEEGYCICFH